MGHTAGRYGKIDYPKLAKYGFYVGATMFLVGALGEMLLSSVLAAEVPGWIHSVLFDIEVVGLLVGFFSPWVFGIILPLTE